MLKEKPQHSVLIVSSSEKGLNLIAYLLPPDSFNPVMSVKSAGEAKRLMLNSAFDLVIINSPLTDETGCDLAKSITENSSICVLLIAKSDMVNEFTYQVEGYGVLTLAKPHTRQMFYQTVNLLSATRERLRSLEKKNASMQAKMEEIRIVNRAKWVLIDYLKMNESQAHRYIEKQAMDMRMTKREVAENIIKTYE